MGFNNDMKEKAIFATETTDFGSGYTSTYKTTKFSDWCRLKRKRLSQCFSGANCLPTRSASPETFYDEKEAPPWAGYNTSRHYGFTCSQRYKPAQHKFDPTKRHIWVDRYDDTRRLTGFLSWRIAKGEFIDEEAGSDCTMGWTASDTDWKKYVVLRVYSCKDDIPPDTIEEACARHVGLVKIDLNGFDWDQCPTRVHADGNKYYKGWFDIKSRLDESGKLVFSLYHEGKFVAKNSIDISKDHAQGWVY